MPPAPRIAPKHPMVMMTVTKQREHRPLPGMILIAETQESLPIVLIQGFRVGFDGEYGSGRERLCRGLPRTLGVDKIFQ